MKKRSLSYQKKKERLHKQLCLSLRDMILKTYESMSSSVDLDIEEAKKTGDKEKLKELREFRKEVIKHSKKVKSSLSGDTHETLYR